MDIILYNIIVGFVCLIFGYFFGSIPTGLIIGKKFYNQDPREAGSKNLGGTNVGRLFGKKAGLITIILDMFKIMIPTAAIWAVIQFSGIKDVFEANLGSKMWDDAVFYIYLTPIGASLGHVFPIFANFKGGKTVSVYAGICTLTSWAMFVFGAVAFFGTLKKTKYVSLSSIMMAVTGVIVAWVMFALHFVVPVEFWHIGMNGNGLFLLSGWEHATMVTFVAMLLVIRHSSNIQRIAAGNERKISWMK